MNFNNTHPELKDGEMFIGNVTKSFYNHNIGWQTKRMGITAYTPDGEVIFNRLSTTLYPTFIQKKEYNNR